MKSEKIKKFKGESGCWIGSEIESRQDAVASWVNAVHSASSFQH